MAAKTENWEPEPNIYTPLSFQELFGILKRFPDAVPWAGGTSLGRGNRPVASLNIPRHTVSLGRIAELRRITRTERYLEAGSMVRINEIIRLGKIVPDVLVKSLQTSASYQLRNLMTLGGLIASAASTGVATALLPKPESGGAESPVPVAPGSGAPDQNDSAPAAPGAESPPEPSARKTGAPESRLPARFRSPGSAAVFIALDARFELRNAESARWISAARYYSPGQGAEGARSPRRGRLFFGKTPAPDEKNAGREILTRVRIPLEEWNWSVIRRFQGQGQISTAVILANMEKNILSGLRIILATDRIIRSQDAESALAGKSIPLDRRAVDHFLEIWDAALEDSGPPAPMIRSILLNFLENCVSGFGC